MAKATKDIEVGWELPPVTRMVTLEAGRTYSGWPQKKDFHTDRDVAKSLGFKGPIMQGSLGAAFISEMLTDFFGESWNKGGRLEMKYIGVVYPPEHVTARAVIREKTAEGDKIRLTLDVWAENGKGDKGAIGSATALVS